MIFVYIILQPKHAGGQPSSHQGGSGYGAQGCCYSPFTLVLVILASLCFTPAGWIARRYYAEVYYAL